MSSRIRGVLIDLNGTIHVGNKRIEGTIEAIKLLRNNNFKLKFVTNTSKESREYIYKRLNHLYGNLISLNEIYSSLYAAKTIIKEQQLNPFCMLNDEALDEFSDLSDQFNNNQYNCVLIGHAPDKLTHNNMSKALRILKEYPNSLLIGLNKSRYFMSEDGLLIGPGAYVSALEYSTNKTAIIIGKPSKDFFETAANDIDCKLNECVMIGDDIVDDVYGAIQYGMQGILVKTGKYKRGDENTSNPYSSSSSPVICDSILHAAQWICSQK